MARVKAEAIEGMYDLLETVDGQQEIYRISAARDQSGKDISMVSGTNHSSLDRHYFQNDDKKDKTHRAQNVYLSRPT